MISYFWQWITQSVSAGLSWLNTVFTSGSMNDFLKLFLAVFALIIVITYIIKPLITAETGSDKAKKRNE